MARRIRERRIIWFHTWEQYSKPLEASPLVGGAPAGVFSKIFGVVEFKDGIRRVDPTEIKFCDEENEMLSVFNKKESKDENWAHIHEK